MDSKVNLHLTVRLFRQAVKLRWRHGALLAGWLGRVPGHKAASVPESCCGRLSPLFARYLRSQFIEAATEVGDIVKSLLSNGFSHRASLRAVLTKNDDARVVVLHG
jgi:hypothetical protein